MNTNEKKNLLLKSIYDITDENIIDTLYGLLVGKDNERIFKLTEQELKALDEAEKDVMNGKFLTHEEADAEIKKWLGK